MILYGLWSGGMAYCSGRNKDLTRCRNKGYTINMAYGYWCRWHKEQEKEQS